jgi:hypothetical protein
MNRFSVTCKALAKWVFFSAIGVVTFPAFAAPSVNVISPRSGVSAGSPIFYEAYATSPTCSKGLSAMRIYSAPNVVAFTVKGAHLETFIKLATGTYHTVVQAWDNCGGVGKIAVSVTVNSTSGVSVFLPNSTSASAPVHIAASAQNSACAAGMSAIRIYTGNGVSPYTIRSNQLNTYLNFLPGTYGLTVKAWDKCGHVFKSQSPELVTSTSDAYLYAVNMRPAAPDLYQFKIASDGTLKNPNGSNALIPVGGSYMHPRSVASTDTKSIDRMAILCQCPAHLFH